MSNETAKAKHERENAAITAAETAREAFWLVATSEDASISWSANPTYRRAKLALYAAIHLAYPDLDPEKVFWAGVVDGETVVHSAKVARENREDKFDAKMESAYEHLHDTDAPR